MTMALPERARSFGRPRALTGDASTTASPPVVREINGSLGGFGSEEVYEPRRRVKRNVSCEMKRAVEHLEYSEVELELLADSKTFAALKRSLRNKGAVTNEVLKQKLPLVLKMKNDSLARTNPEAAKAIRKGPSRTFSSGRPISNIERNSSFKAANRVLSESEKTEAAPTHIQNVGQSLGRIMRPGTRRPAPPRTKSSNI